MDKIAVIGGGTIGSSWAVFFASKGMDVSVYEIGEDAIKIANNRMKEMIDFLNVKGFINSSTNEVLSKIKTSSEMPSVVKNASFIQEAVPEKYDLKGKVFREIEKDASDTAIIASSTSTLSTNTMQEYLTNPERFIVAHPFNPPHLIPLVEIVKGDKTSDKTVEKAKDFYKNLGKEPVLLNKEAPGHIANRLCAALWREAIDLVNEGVCSVEDVDKAVSSGPGLRWALMGPNLTYHLGGGEGGLRHFIDHLGPAFEDMFRDLAEWDQIPEEAKEKLIEGTNEMVKDKDLTTLSNWRDEKLVKILKALE